MTKVDNELFLDLIKIVFYLHGEFDEEMPLDLIENCYCRVMPYIHAKRKREAFTAYKTANPEVRELLRKTYLNIAGIQETFRSSQELSLSD